MKVWTIVKNFLHLSMVLHMKEDQLVKEFELNNDDLKMIGIVAG
ncbi:MAG: hypothetical protein ACE5GV_04975 [Candidatus Scalindua sp.]